MEEVVIIGAGVAGLSCMNALLDCGIQPLLLDAGTIGSPKLCGEFLSLAALSQLEAWNIGPIQKIQKINMYSKKTSLSLQQPTGAMSRAEVELQLATRARNMGGQILENKKIEYTAPGKFTLSDKTPIVAKQYIIATGRLGAMPTHFPYMGLKAHFLHDSYTPCLEMHLFEGGYYGIIPISPTTSNIACLVRQSAYNQAYIEMNKKLAWLTAPIGAFGLKKVPTLPNTYWIGDAIATFPPAIGGGFSHAINSSNLAVRYLLKNNPEGYRREIEHRQKSKMRWAKLLHQVMLSPPASNFALHFLQKAPKIKARLLHHIGLTSTL